jgi:hypothetical protein
MLKCNSCPHLRLKQMLGYDSESFTRAAQILRMPP